MYFKGEIQVGLFPSLLPYLLIWKKKINVCGGGHSRDLVKTECGFVTISFEKDQNQVLKGVTGLPRSVFVFCQCSPRARIKQWPAKCASQKLP